MAGERILGQQISRNEVLGLVFRLTLLGALTYYGVKWMVKTLDPTRKSKQESKKRAERILDRIGVKNVNLTEYELAIAAQLVDPTTINVTWDCIAGLDDIIQEIRETVILPIQNKELFSGSNLIQPPKGVLLHGPPGCGKTMIAKATAKEAGARFINLEVSNLTDKWYGESQKLASAVFTLAIKIQPCIVFVDEIDSFLRSRDSSDHEATAMMKAQFMSLWDGLITDSSVHVVVMGATNRPQDVDRAILRRMPAMFSIGLPGPLQRQGILKLVLQKEVVSDDVNIEQLAKATDGFSGSDMRELCRSAALYRVKDYLKDAPSSSKVAKVEAVSPNDDRYHDAIRPMCKDDFMSALGRMKLSKIRAGQSKEAVFDLD